MCPIPGHADDSQAGPRSGVLPFRRVSGIVGAVQHGRASRRGCVVMSELSRGWAGACARCSRSHSCRTVGASRAGTLSTISSQTDASASCGRGVRWRVTKVVDTEADSAVPGWRGVMPVIEPGGNARAHSRHSSRAGQRRHWAVASARRRGSGRGSSGHRSRSWAAGSATHNAPRRFANPCKIAIINATGPASRRGGIAIATPLPPEFLPQRVARTPARPVSPPTIPPLFLPITR